MKNIRLQKEREIVRSLAEKAAQYSLSKENQTICQRWKDVNALRKPDRAPVWCRPFGCWKEIIPPESLICRAPLLRQLENYFKQILYKVEYVRDDNPLTEYFKVRAIFDVFPENKWGVEVGKNKPSLEGGAWSYDPPIKKKRDIKKLVTPVFSYNKKATDELFEKTSELLAGILPVKLSVGPEYESATLGKDAADLRGLEQMMIDMILEPEITHSLMGYMQSARMALLDTYESVGITANTDQPMIFSDAVNPCHEGNDTLKDCWCTGNSQEFDQVSPEMFEKFCLEYQKPIFERFGYSCYGCCEDLSKKLDAVLSISNLRIIVCSAWTGLEPVLNKVNNDYCIMWRQKASDIVMVDNISGIKEDIEESLKNLQGQYYQIVLRELETLNGNMDRLKVWAEIAKELAGKYN